MKEYSITITTLPSGKFKYTQKYLDPYASTLGKLKYRSVSCTLSKNTKQAQAKAHAILAERIKLNLGRLGTSSVTLNQLFELYAKHYDVTKPGAELEPSYQTYYNYQFHIKKYIESLKGSDPIVSKLDVPFFKQYFDDMQRHYSYSYCNIRRSALFHHFTFGVDFGYIKINPILGLKLNRQRLDNVALIENKYFTDKEYNDLISYIRDAKRYDYADFFEVMYFTGLRLSEIAGLQVKDFKKIDGKYSLVIDGILVKRHIKSSKIRPQKRKSTKTNAGMRVVYLPPKAVVICKRHAKNKADTAILFTKQGSRNSPFTVSDVNQYLARIAPKIGITKHLSSHFFRHTHISKLASMGVPLADIKKRVGHESAKTTEQIYYHILSSGKKQLESIVDKL